MKLKFRHSISTLRRSKGGTGAIGFASYIAREKYFDEEFGETINKMGKAEKDHECKFSKVYGPEWMDPSLEDPETLWNKIDKIETGNAIALKHEISLPNGMTDDQAIEFAEEWGKGLSSTGQPVQIAYHQKPGNIHLHALCPDRMLAKNGIDFKPKSIRMYECINNQTGEIKYFHRVKEIEPGFERVPERDKNGKIKTEFKSKKHKTPSVVWKRVKVDQTYGHHEYDPKKLKELKANHQTAVEHGRRNTSKLLCKKCEMYGHDPKPWCHKSYKRLGIYRKPTIHEGSGVIALENKAKAEAKKLGIAYKPVTEIRKKNLKIEAFNKKIERAFGKNPKIKQVNRALKFAQTKLKNGRSAFLQKAKNTRPREWLQAITMSSIDGQTPLLSKMVSMCKKPLAFSVVANAQNQQKDLERIYKTTKSTPTKDKIKKSLIPEMPSRGGGRDNGAR